ncbi:MAG TPA: hypothetical protein VN541_17625 [Tepidisphaeraceae bacterium]|nr:hypothetical protein [Tepidisphaeraceae bacterium]
MLRRSFAVLSALSLLLCLTTAVFWVGSYRHPDFIRLDRGNTNVRILGSEDGAVFVRRVTIDMANRQMHVLSIFPEYICPYFVPFAMTLVLPIGYLARRILVRRTRVRLGHCIRCGYDLTGNISGVCPECGTPVRQASEAGA